MILKTFSRPKCKKGCKSRNHLIYTLCGGETGSRTYIFKKYHKIANY